MQDREHSGRTGPTPHQISHQTLGKVLIAIGITIYASAMIINPWVVTLYLRGALNLLDVQMGYFVSAFAAGTVLILTGLVVNKVKLKGAEPLSALLISIVFIILVDRLILAFIGLPLWMYDSERHYQHRPNVSRMYADGLIVNTNRFGHHDDDLKIKKEAQAFRVLLLGDSVTMGHRVPAELTFERHLENLLNQHHSDLGKIEVINTGVQGYSTEQEYITLKKNIIFQPDLILLCFYTNDVTEPYVFHSHEEGEDIDYHQIKASPHPLFGFLVNETGFGRLLLSLQKETVTLASVERTSLASMKTMSRLDQNDPKYAAQWKHVLTYMKKIYEFCRETNTPVVLVHFPSLFQLMDDEHRKPQEVLRHHSASEHIPYWDLTHTLQDAILGTSPERSITDLGLSPEEIK
ncbi:MAG: SGNH/GDSL hydrolase family protein, partial [Verrucomicrobiota bacterium]